MSKSCSWIKWIEDRAWSNLKQRWHPVKIVYSLLKPSLKSFKVNHNIFISHKTFFWFSKKIWNMILQIKFLPDYPFLNTRVLSWFIVGFMLLNLYFSVYCFVDHCLSFFLWPLYCLILLRFMSFDYPFGIFYLIFYKGTSFWLLFFIS